MLTPLRDWIPALGVAGLLAPMIVWGTVMTSGVPNCRPDAGALVVEASAQAGHSAGRGGCVVRDDRGWVDAADGADPGFSGGEIARWSVSGAAVVLCVGAFISWRRAQRRGPRYLCRLPATLRRAAGGMSCMMFDVSQRGALLSLPPGHDIEKGERFRIDWGDDPVEVQARWSKPLYVGVAFAKPLSEACLARTLAMNAALRGPDGKRRGSVADRLPQEARVGEPRMLPTARRV